MTRRPVERVERHAAIDPAGGVAGVERVRQWRQEIFVDAGSVPDQRQLFAANGLGELIGREAADQGLGQRALDSPSR
jgi:hypothetical protein